MTEKVEDAAPKELAKKKKTKRSTSSRKESGMSSSARSSGRGRREGDGDEKRRRSRSSDKSRSRRDSGLKRTVERDRNSAEGSITMDGSERRERSNNREGAMKGSGRHNHTTSPQRARRTKSEAITTKSEIKGGMKDRSRSRSPTRTASATAATHAPRLPQRTTSDSSSLQSALESTRLRGEREKVVKKDSFDEASLGDFKLYVQQQQQKRSGSSPSTSMMASRQKMGDIPEESLGSFTAFHTKYEQEKLLGLHDDDDGPDVYGQRSTKAPPTPLIQENDANANEMSCSLGALMSPVNQYGNAPKAQPRVTVEDSLGSFAAFNTKPKALVEESLGSFTAFHTQYEEEKLLGLHDSTMSALQSAAPLVEKPPAIPEESMGDFVHMASKDNGGKLDDSFGASGKMKPTGKKSGIEEYPEIVLPKNRIEKLGKRGGVAYRIMVDTPGGHATEPMKIVVAIEFDDDSDSESDESDDEEEEDPLENADAILNKQNSIGEPATPQHNSMESGDDEDNEMYESGHLPLSALEDDVAQKEPTNTQNRKKRQGRKSNDGLVGRQQRLLAGQGDESDSEDDDDVGPLAANINRWSHQAPAAAAAGGSSPKQPEREKSRHSHSTHSTVSSLTLESALERGVPSRTDAGPLYEGGVQRKSVGINRGQGSLTNTGIRRPSGMVQAAGTAALLKRPSVVTPHNLGTKRGLLLRQQSEASMKSTSTAKSNDSSWVGPNNDMPDEYQASFMQLNLTNLEKTEMQTNEEVEQAELPDALRSGVEGIEGNDTVQPRALPLPEELETIPEGKDPIAAASELLGMKTMLKHIKRVAPKRSKSFDFDRDMPKQMWNKMFAKKGELPGSQYVDNEDSTGHEEDENMPSTKGPAEMPKAEDQQAEPADEKAKSMTAGLFSTIKRVASAAPTASKPTESSGSKGKSSIWSSTIKRVIPSAKEPSANETSTQEQTENTNDDPSEASMELDGILQELDKSLAHHLDASEYSAEPGPSMRRDESGKGNDGSARGTRSGRGDVPRKGGTARSRAARAQHVHNRSLRDTIDYYTAEQEDDELPQLDAINEEEARRKPRIRTRRKAPNRTKSADEGMSRSARFKSEVTRGVVHRTRSQEASPSRPSRENVKKMHQSFTGVDPAEAPPFRRQTSRDSVPSKPRSRDPAAAPNRTRSHEKGLRGSGKMKRPQRKRSNGGASDEAEVVITKRGAELPENATEEELREILDYH